MTTGRPSYAYVLTWILGEALSDNVLDHSSPSGYFVDPRRPFGSNGSLPLGVPLPWRATPVSGRRNSPGLARPIVVVCAARLRRGAECQPIVGEPGIMLLRLPTYMTAERLGPR